MSRSWLCLGLSALALAACQPAEKAAAALQADPPPVLGENDQPDPVAAEALAEPSESGTEDPIEPVPDDTADDEADDHAHHDGDHDEQTGADDHDHAGGEAHVHGSSEMAVSLDGNSVAISLEGALANFDLDESLREISDPTPYTTGVLALRGGDCTPDMVSAFIRPVGDHGNMMLDFVYTCAAIEDLTGIDVTAFSKFSGFLEVDAVVLTATGQTAKTLTASDTLLDLP